MNKIAIILISIVFIFSGSSWASERSASVKAHSHYYPSTEVLGENYHVRLVVDQSKGEAALIFEDINENPIDLIRAKRLKAQVILPDGTVKEDFFRILNRGSDQRRRSHKRSQVYWVKRPLSGKFLTTSDWIKSTPEFELKLMIPVKGENYPVNFSYKVEGGAIASHSK